MMYVFLVLIAVFGSGAITIRTEPFPSMEACNAASQALPTKTLDVRTNELAICVPQYGVQ